MTPVGSRKFNLFNSFFLCTVCMSICNVSMDLLYKGSSKSPFVFSGFYLFCSFSLRFFKVCKIGRWKGALSLQFISGGKLQAAGSSCW